MELFVESFYELIDRNMCYLGRTSITRPAYWTCIMLLNCVNCKADIGTDSVK